MYAVYHGPDGLRAIAERTHRYAAALAAALRDAGVEVVHERSSTPYRARVPGRRGRGGRRGPRARRAPAARGRRPRRRSPPRRPPTPSAPRRGARRVRRATSVDLDAVDARPADDAARASWCGQTEFLTHEVFNTHRSETSMLRYLRRLSARDYALDRGMIPLGSCTMKLNATTEMEPISLPGFADLHPFAPAEDALGYAELIEELESLAGRGHRLRPGLDPAERRLAGRARRAARDPRLPPGQRRGGARRLPDPVVGARHQRRLGGDGRDAGRGRQGRRRRARRHGRPAGPVRRRTPTTSPRSWSPTPRRTAPTRTASPSCARSCTSTAARCTSTGRTSTRCSATPGRASSAATCRTSTCTRRSASRTAVAAPASGRSAVRAHLAPYLPSRTRCTPSPTGATGIGPISAAPYGSAGILPISWAYVRMMGGAGLTRGDRGRRALGELRRGAARGALPGALQGPRRPGRARVHPRPARADQAAAASPSTTSPSGWSTTASTRRR